jgi:hypothetical protein
MVGYSDADWGGDPDTYRSSSGSVFMLFGGAVCWRARLQKLVALSTCEAELYALCETMKQAIWIRENLGKLDLDLDFLDSPFEIREDNAAALVIATTGRQKPRTMHIGLSHSWIHDKVKSDNFAIVKCSSDDMLADIFTKPLGTVKFAGLRSRIGVVDCSTQGVC